MTEIARRTFQDFAIPLIVRFPLDDQGSFLVTTKVHGDELPVFQGAAIDRYSGEVLDYFSWRDAHAMERLRSLSLAVHFGSIYGLPSKIAAVAGCIAVPVLCATGYLIWWWKRPPKNGLHKATAHRAATTSLPLWLWGVVIAFCIVFPMVGVSCLSLAIGQGCRRFALRLARTAS